MTPVEGIWSIGPSPHFRESSRRREEETMTNPFVPILIMFGLAALLAVGGMAASAVIGPKRYNKVKVDAYECGSQPTRQDRKSTRLHSSHVSSSYAVFCL